MLKFEVGNIYACRSACDHDCIWYFRVVDRTMKNVPRYPANLFAGGIGTIQFFRHTGSEYTALRFPYSCYLRSLRSNLTTIACYPRTDRF